MRARLRVAASLTLLARAAAAPLHGEQHALSASASSDSVRTASNKLQIYIIADEERFNDGRVANLTSRLGDPDRYEILRIEPVYVKNTTCKKSYSDNVLGVRGCFLAHLEFWKAVAASGQRGLVLESDFVFDEQQSPEEFRSMLHSAWDERPEEDLTSVGWCSWCFKDNLVTSADGGTTCTKLSYLCTTAYIVSPTYARALVNLEPTDGTEQCLPADNALMHMCADQSNVYSLEEKTEEAKELGLAAAPTCSWPDYPDFVTNANPAINYGWPGGLFQQDRRHYSSSIGSEGPPKPQSS